MTVCNVAVSSGVVGGVDATERAKAPMRMINAAAIPIHGNRAGAEWIGRLIIGNFVRAMIVYPAHYLRTASQLQLMPANAGRR